MSLLERLRLYFYPCEHKWRPCTKYETKDESLPENSFWKSKTTTNFYPGRYCERCDTFEPLTVEMFYAYFGRMPI